MPGTSTHRRPLPRRCLYGCRVDDRTSAFVHTFVSPASSNTEMKESGKRFAFRRSGGGGYRPSGGCLTSAGNLNWTRLRASEHSDGGARISSTRLQTHAPGWRLQARSTLHRNRAGYCALRCCVGALSVRLSAFEERARSPLVPRRQRVTPPRSARFWPVNARDGAKCVAQADKDAPEDFVANFAPASKWKREIRTKRGRNKTRQGADTESFHR